MADVQRTISGFLDTVTGLFKDNTAGDISAQDLRDLVASIAYGLRGHLYGLAITSNATDPTNDLDIAVGSTWDNTNDVLLRLTTAITKRLDAAWAVGTNAGGLDTGAIADTTYYVWLIRRSDTGVVDVLISTSSTSPTMPTNYDQKGVIGSFARTAGAIVTGSFVKSNDTGWVWHEATGTLAADASITITHAADSSNQRLPVFLLNAPNNTISLLLHGDGADASTTFTDSSTAALTVTPSGNAQLDTAQFKFGSASMLFDGTGDYLSVSDSNLSFSADFTLQFWYRPTSSHVSFRLIADSRTSDADTAGIGIGTNATGQVFFYTNGGFQITGAALTLDTWYHIAVTRTGSSIKLWINGTQSGATYTSSTAFTRSAWKIGADWNTIYFANGWIDEFQMNTGEALYTATFTPPVAATANPVLTVMPAILTNSHVPGQDTDRVRVAYNDGAGASATTKTTFTNKLGRSVTYYAKVGVRVGSSTAWTGTITGSISQRGTIDGLTISNNTVDTVNDIDITSGIAWENSSSVMINLAAAITGKQLDAVWAVGSSAGMRASGAAIANTTYHIFLIRRTDTGVVDIAADTSATGANIAANTNAAYTQKRRIGSILREGAAIVPFLQFSDQFIRKTPLSVSSVSNPGTSAQTLTVGVPTGIKVEADIGMVLEKTETALVYLWLSSLDGTDLTPSAFINHLNSVIITGTSYNAGRGKAWTNTSAQVRWRLNSSAAGTVVYPSAYGWMDKRGKDAA